MSHGSRHNLAMTALVSMVIGGIAATPASAAGPIFANVLLFGSAEQAALSPEEYEEYAEQSRSSLAPEPEEVRSFESLRTKPIKLQSDTETGKRYSVFGFRGAKNSFLLPLYKEQAYTQKDSHRLLDGWGLKWQHEMESGHSFAVSAHRADNLYQQDDIVTGETTSTMASFSWTGRWKGNYKPSFTGSLFLGDENAADEKESEFGRRYYGFSVGGEMTLFRKHTPYLSLKMQKNEYADASYNGDTLFDESLLATDQTVNPLYGPEFYSRLSAGWNWKVRSNWSVTAEANYLLEDSESELNIDESRFYFGTRYDFR